MEWRGWTPSPITTTLLAPLFPGPGPAAALPGAASICTAHVFAPGVFHVGDGGAVWCGAEGVAGVHGGGFQVGERVDGTREERKSRERGNRREQGDRRDWEGELRTTELPRWFPVKCPRKIPI